MIVAPHRSGHLLAISDSQLGGGDFAKLAAFPGYFKWQERNCIFRITGANLLHILKHWPDAKWIGGTDEVLKDFLAKEGLAQETRDVKAQPGRILSDRGYHYKRTPMKHQRQAFALSRDREVFGLFMEQGTGKTKVALDTAQWLWEHRKIEMLIVVAWPNGVHRNWIDYEIPADVKEPYLTEYWSSNYNTRHRQEAFSRFVDAKKNKLKIFCMNVEALAGANARTFLINLLQTHKSLLLIDQSASIKNPAAKRTKFLLKIAAGAPYRRILDGQPVAEGASELFSQFKFLDHFIIGHDTWTGFKAEFCKVGFFNEIVGYKNMDILHQRIDGNCFRVREEECMDLPPRIYKPWSFKLSDSEQRIYDDLKLAGFAMFEDVALPDETNSIMEHHALVKNMRLQQISSGWFPADKMRLIHEPMPSRAEALMNLIESLQGDKALIYARFRADLSLIQKLVGEKGLSYHGGVKEDQRRIAIKRFMNDKKIQFFIGQPRSAGLGITLTEAKHVIFYSNDHSLRLREECEKRAHRKGLKHRLIIWDLIAQGTHDGNIVRAFRGKKELANEILKDPDNFFLRYE